MVEILNKKCNIYPWEFAQEISEMFTVHKHKLSLETPNTEIICYENENLIVLHTITAMKGPLRKNLATRNPQTLSEIHKLFITDFNYLKNNPTNHQTSIQKLYFQQDINTHKQVQNKPFSSQPIWFQCFNTIENVCTTEGIESLSNQTDSDVHVNQTNYQTRKIFPCPSTSLDKSITTPLDIGRDAEYLPISH